MFLTARQLETMHRESGSNGRLVLPYRARLTPAAQDWVKLKRLALGYSDDGASAPFRGRSQNAVMVPGGGANGSAHGPAHGSQGATPDAHGGTTGTTLWWCDGPCGAAKAALTAQSKESMLRAIDLPADAKQTVAVIRLVAGELKAGSAAAAVLAVENAAAVMVFANRCPSIRAVVGTCLEAVEQGIRQVAANVLVIEHPHKTLPQVKSMLARFARAKRDLSPEVQRQLAELATCG